MALLRLTRWTVRTLTGSALLVALAIGGFVFALQTPRVQTAVRARLERLLGDATGARVSIGHLGGPLLTGVTARDVRFTFHAGTRVAVAELSASYLLPALLAGRIELGTVRLDGVRARLVHRAGGWGFSGASATTEEATALPTLNVRRLQITDGRLGIELADAHPARRGALTDLALEGEMAAGPGGIRITIDTLGARPRGLDLSRLSASGVVSVGDSGEVDIADLALATRHTRLRGAARIAMDRWLDARLAVEKLAAHELRAVIPEVALQRDLAGTIVARGPWRRIAVRAAIDAGAASRLRLFGVVDAAGHDLPYRATARTRHLDLATLDPTWPASDLTGRLRGRGAITTLAVPLELRLALLPSALAGQPIEAAQLGGRLQDTTLTVRGTVALAAGDAKVDGQLSWANALTYRAHVRAMVTDLARLAPGVVGSGSVRLTLAGTGVDTPGRRLSASALVEGATIQGYALDRAQAELTLHDDVLTVAGGRFTAAGLDGEASGTLDLARRTLDAALATGGDVSAAARAAGADAGGTVRARATVRGPLDALAIEGAASGERLRFGVLRLGRATVTATAAGVGGAAPGGRLRLDATELRPSTGPAWSGTAAAEWRRTSGSDGATVTLEAHTDDGGRVATRGSVRRDAAGGVAAELASLEVTMPEVGAWQLLRPATVTLADGAAVVDRLALGAGSQRLTLAGRVGRTGPADATLEWNGIDVATVCRLRSTLGCTGRTTGSARLTGSAAAPRLALSLGGEDIVVEGSPAATLGFTGEYAGRALALTGTIAQADAGRLDLRGTIPFDLAWDGPQRTVTGGPLDVTLRTDGLDLAIVRLLAPDTVRQSAGRLTADLRITGAWDALRANGALALANGRFGLAATGVVYEDVTVDAVVTGDTLEVRRAHARAGSGTMEGSGQLALGTSRTTPFTLALRFDDFLAVSQPAYEAATNGTLSIEGTLAYPVVRGELTLTRLLVRPTVLSATSGPSLAPDPTIEVVGLDEPVSAPTAGSGEAPSIAEAVSLDVAIRITRNAWIRRSDADVEIRGDIQLGKAAFHPLFVTGEYRLERGWYAFQGRRFDLQEGLIVFGGDVPPDPQLDIAATHRAGEYLVTVAITGRASQPALALSSEPALDQADVLSVLVFGRPARDLGSEQSVDLQRQAISLASGYIAPELRKSVMDTLDLDTFEIGDEGLRAGRYVTRDVFVTLAQDFTGRAGQVMGVEYAITRRLSVKLSTSTRGDSAVDLLWRRRY